MFRSLSKDLNSLHIQIRKWFYEENRACLRIHFGTGAGKKEKVDDAGGNSESAWHIAQHGQRGDRSPEKDERREGEVEKLRYRGRQKDTPLLGKHTQHRKKNAAGRRIRGLQRVQDKIQGRTGGLFGGLCLWRSGNGQKEISAVEKQAEFVCYGPGGAKDYNCQYLC